MTIKLNLNDSSKFDIDSLRLRPPSIVMKLDRLGSFHPSRISFARTLLRRIQKEQWKCEISHDTMNDQGHGDFVYSISTPGGPLSFVAFSTPLKKRDRTDRVIATKWDMSFTLVNGTVSQSDIDRLRNEVPKQEAGRLSNREIVLSRANKSVRLFQEIANKLASGKQPGTEKIASIGYLVRTTAVYGNGKFGVMDFDTVKSSTPFGLPFQAEMFTVYMARQFSFEVLERVAKGISSENFVPLDRNIKQSLGVGNATGLGMAPFLVGHPQLIHQWIYVREVAIAKVLNVRKISKSKLSNFKNLLKKVSAHLNQWNTDDARQSKRISVLKSEVGQFESIVEPCLNAKHPWRQIANKINQSMSLEGAELFNSVLLEIYPELVNELEHHLGIDEWNFINPVMTLEGLKDLLEQHYDWALNISFEQPESQFLFWYFSADKEEPRLGHRYEEPGEELEMRIGVARDVCRLYEDICQRLATSVQCSVAEFLRDHPNHRYIVTRVQSLEKYPYAEIRNNLLDIQCLPLDLLRCKLAIFGATRFDPKSNLWTRITLFQGAPLVDQLDRINADGWAFPSVKTP